MAWFKLSHCKLCWRISFAVFALIFAIESLLLIPSAQRFRKTERQRLAGEAQIVIDPILMHVRVEQLSSNLLSLVGSHGIISVAIYDRHGKLFLSSHDAPEILSSGDIGTMASPLESSGNAIVRAAWRSSSLEGVIVLVSMDGAGVERELLAHVIRILGLVAIVVLFVTVGTMMVLHIWVLQPLLTLRASSIAAGADPEKASRIARNLTAHGELGELIAAHRNMLTDLIDGRKRDQQIAEERARFLTHHDTTTGLPNR